MIDLFLQEQANILIAAGVFSLFLAFFAMEMKFQSVHKKNAVVQIELGAAVMLVSDAFTFILAGKSGTPAYVGYQIVNFLTFIMIDGMLYFFNYYITYMFMETGRFAKLPKRLLAGYILTSIGMTMVVISMFGGMYYYIDAGNIYHRGELYPLSFIVPFVVLVIQFTFIMQHRHLVRHSLFVPMLLFCLLPLAAACLQLYFQGISFIDFSIWFGATLLFWVTLIDQNQFLSKAASTEVMTGLPNTYGYMDRVEHIMQTHDITAYNAYYFDIVGMSRINNTYSKEVGDEIIRNYAKTILKQLDNDEVLGRLGGNFFVALVKKIHTDDFLAMLGDTPISFEANGKQETIHLSAVTGGYKITSKNIAAGQIMGYISTAVNYAKNVTKQPYVFLDDELQQKILEEKQWEEEIRAALKTDEFIAYYQPKVNIETNELCGAEALVRWNHKGEILSPYLFVPVMERNGCVCDLDYEMLKNVCRDLREWIDKGLEPPRVSVNFSRRNLSDQRLAERIHNVIKKYEIPEDLVQIEITETVDDFSMERLAVFIDRLHSYGITVAIDDFGTRSSSIKLLKEVPFDVLKIDKTFVDYADDKDKMLLSYIIGMAHAIETDVIAEGVEEADRVQMLRAMGCMEIQGYVFDRPLNKETYEERLRNKKYTC